METYYINERSNNVQNDDRERRVEILSIRFTVCYLKSWVTVYVDTIKH